MTLHLRRELMKTYFPRQYTIIIIIVEFYLENPQTDLAILLPGAVLWDIYIQPCRIFMQCMIVLLPFMTTIAYRRSRAFDILIYGLFLKI